VYVQSAIQKVEDFTGLYGDLRTVEDERHRVRFRSSLWLNHRPVESVASVGRVDGSLTWDVADLDVDAETGVVRVVSGPLFSGLLTVTYDAGYPEGELPERLNLAARIIVQHLWQTQRGAMVSAGVRAALEDSFQNLVGGGRGYAIPNAALELLGEPTPVVS
jgi:hypothetical protein